MQAEEFQEIIRDLFIVSAITKRPAEALLRDAVDAVCGEYRGFNGKIAGIRGLYVKRPTEIELHQSKKHQTPPPETQQLPCTILGVEKSILLMGMTSL